jgi:hypothetical protein
MADPVRTNDELQTVERVLDVVLTRPLARLLYAGWLIGRYSLRAARYGCGWLRARWVKARQEA